MSHQICNGLKVNSPFLYLQSEDKTMASICHSPLDLLNKMGNTWKEFPLIFQSAVNGELRSPEALQCANNYIISLMSTDGNKEVMYNKLLHHVYCCEKHCFYSTHVQVTGFFRVRKASRHGKLYVLHSPDRDHFCTCTNSNMGRLKEIAWFVFKMRLSNGN